MVTKALVTDNPRPCTVFHFVPSYFFSSSALTSTEQFPFTPWNNRAAIRGYAQLTVENRKRTGGRERTEKGVRWIFTSGRRGLYKGCRAGERCRNPYCSCCCPRRWRCSRRPSALRIPPLPCPRGTHKVLSSPGRGETDGSENTILM